MKHLVTIGIMLALLLGLTLPAQAKKVGFECPVTIDGTTPEKRAEIAKLLPVGNAMDDPGRLNASIDSLKRLGLSRTLIIDHLIGAYCPTVAQNKSLSDAERTALVRRFASRITVLVYDVEDTSEIVLNVVLKPSIVDEVNAKARKNGLSVEGWLSKTIEQAVQQP
jgi:hypothetical protein